MNFARHPGGHVVYVHHTVGPVGHNGTQQFPKLTDCELIRIMSTPILEHIVKVYCTKEDKPLNAQNILSHLKEIVECSKSILCAMERQHGYCSCECLGAMRRNQEASGKTCDVVYRALMVCFTFADLQIQLDSICAKRSSRPSPRNGGTANSGGEASGSTSAEERLKCLFDRLDKLQRESDEIQQQITTMVNHT